MNKKATHNTPHRAPNENTEGLYEKAIIVEGIEPVDLYGVNNVLYDWLAAQFPTLKIVARGNEIKVFGKDSEIDDFENKLLQLIDYHARKGSLTVEDLDLLAGGKPLDAAGIPADVIVYGTDGRAVRARTVNQKKLVTLYEKHDLLFAVGPAGSGKTYTAIALAVCALKNKEIKRIILTRPAVEAGERLGFLPGDMKEKLDPYLQPLYDALNDMIPARKLEKYMEEGTVQIAPLAYMRGRTLDNAFVILDEAQNTTTGQLKMFLTRMGNNAKFIVTGDMTQIDLPRRSDSGLQRVIQWLQPVKGIGFVTFDQRDIIRHPLVKHIVKTFEKYEEEAQAGGF
ncbi:MAG: PhoH family protein [Prevotellaceae bacterium]|jgi:phosphate starvation-inducible PhoH-like protein|nr:PhoH family protein [Prevotellaceae bacterium]